jgi:hypothetical protein
MSPTVTRASVFVRFRAPLHHYKQKNKQALFCSELPGKTSQQGYTDIENL